MNLKFWKKREKKDIVQYKDGMYYLGTGTISAPKMTNYLKASMINEAVYGCISLITMAALEVPWYVFRQEGKNIIEITDHALVRFTKRPSKTLSWSTFIEEYLNYLLLSGNFYSRKIIGSFRTYGEIENLRPDKVTIQPGPLGVQRYDYYSRGRINQLDPDEVLHIKLFNPGDEFQGLSPISSIAGQIDIASFSQAWMLALLEKGAMPAVALSTPGTLEPEQREFLKEQVKENVLGYENVMNPLILEGGMEPKKLAFSPDDINFMPLTKSTLRKICSVFNVASELLGDAENKTYSNIKEAHKALYTKATLPHLKTLKDALNIWLVPEFEEESEKGKLFLDYDTSDLEALSEDKDAQWKRVNESVDKGVISRNEGRKIIKFEKAKEKGADKLTVQATIVPLDDVTGDSIEEE